MWISWVRWKNFAIFKHFFLVFLIRIISCLTLVEPIFKPVIFFFHLLQVWTHKKKMPEFSFGIRHSQYLAPLIVDQADWTWTYILIHKFLGSYFSFFFLKRCYTEFFILRFEHISKSKKNFFFRFLVHF